jgi:hypothetical protein
MSFRLASVAVHPEVPTALNHPNILIAGSYAAALVFLLCPFSRMVCVETHVENSMVEDAVSKLAVTLRNGKYCQKRISV